MRSQWSVKQSLVLALRSCGERGKVQRNASTVCRKVWSKTQVRLAFWGLPPSGQRCRWKCRVRLGSGGGKRWGGGRAKLTAYSRSRGRRNIRMYTSFMSHAFPHYQQPPPSWSSLDWLFYEDKKGQEQKEREEGKEVNTMFYGRRKWEESKFMVPWSTSWRSHLYLKVCNKKS